VAEVARRHHRERPREVGGNNRGPWVRAYMMGRGNEGLPWCAGFATTVARQAIQAEGLDDFLPWEPSCDRLGDWARAAGRLSEQPSVGAIVLLREPLPSRGWLHAGIVVETSRGGTVTTIEGNTNAAGGREGIEVERKIRATTGKDFIRLD